MSADAAKTLSPPAGRTIPVVAAQGEGPIARSVLEGLQAIVSSPVASVVIESALALAGESMIPEEPGQASRFISGALMSTLHTTTDTDSAQAFLDRMEPILILASLSPPPGGVVESQVRVSATGERVPLVLFASLDRTHGKEVQKAVGNRIQVETANNVLDLLVRIDRIPEDLPAAIIVDGAAPPIDSVALASMLPDHRPDLSVILWRVPRDQCADIDASRPEEQSWLAFGEGAPLKDVVNLLKEHF